MIRMKTTKICKFQSNRKFDLVNESEINSVNEELKGVNFNAL